MAHESQSFDAYYKWLGIPPEEQPPHHYRLLAIQPFEADLDVIESAADQRMAHVRGRQAGKNSALSQKLLNEIAAAKVELLHPDKKRAYDARLRQALAAREPKVAQAIALPEQSSIQVERKPGPAATARPVVPCRGSGWMVGALIGAGLVIVGAIAVAVFLSRPGSEIAAKTSPAPASKLPDKLAPKAVAPPVVPAEPAEKAPAPVPPTAPDPSPAPMPPTPEAPTEAARPPVPQELPGVDPPAPENPLAAAQPTLAAKTPVPEAALLDKARQTVKEIYAEKFAAARLPEQKSQLAAEIFKQGQDTTDDPVGRYALLDTARRMAEQAGDLDLSLRTCDQLGESYDVELFPLQQSALESCSKLARKQADWQAVAQASLPLIDAAVAAGNYAVAQRFAATALESARKARHKDLTALAVSRSKEVAALVVAYAAAEGAFERLQTDPQDAASHLTAGKFLCFAKRDWSAGLSHLAQGSNEPLARLAKQDLDGAQNDASWVELGDSWLALADKAQEPEKKELQRRAAHWYRLALPMLAGLTQVKVEKLLADLPPEKPPQPLATTPSKPASSKPSPWKPVAGNWKITYADGAIRRYTIDDEGTVVFVETQQRGSLANRGRDILLDFGDGKLERLSLADGALLVEHFNPASNYPGGPALRARGVKEAEASRLLGSDGDGLLVVFEDAPDLLDQLNEGGGTVALETKDFYSGKAALKVTPDQRFVSFLPGLSARIREKPGPGEYRYVRFAWKKIGGEIMGMQLRSIEDEGGKHPGSLWVRYHFGAGQTLMSAASVRLAKELPTEWTVVTRDLYADHGEFTLTGLALTPLDGECGLFDHIYLAREEKDFDRLGKPSPRRTGPQR